MTQKRKRAQQDRIPDRNNPMAIDFRFTGSPLSIQVHASAAGLRYLLLIVLALARILPFLLVPKADGAASLLGSHLMKPAGQVISGPVQAYDTEAFLPSEVLKVSMQGRSIA